MGAVVAEAGCAALVGAAAVAAGRQPCWRLLGVQRWRGLVMQPCRQLVDAETAGTCGCSCCLGRGCAPSGLVLCAWQPESGCASCPRSGSCGRRGKPAALQVCRLPALFPTALGRALPAAPDLLTPLPFAFLPCATLPCATLPPVCLAHVRFPPALFLPFFLPAGLEDYQYGDAGDGDDFDFM